MQSLEDYIFIAFAHSLCIKNLFYAFNYLQ